MPRRPSISPTVSNLRPSPFASLRAQIQAHEGVLHPLHLGDTWRSLPSFAQQEQMVWVKEEDTNRYADPRGVPGLMTAIVRKLRERNGFWWVGPGNVVITGGASAGLVAVCNTILEQGDEVMVLAPYWPTMHGVVTLVGGVPVEVPFYDHVCTAQIEATLERYVTEKTRALYVNTPNNPTGRVLTSDQLEVIAKFAREHDLWVLSDEVYEDYVYLGKHESIANYTGMAERTFTAFSFSKSYGLAGARVGYVVCPQDYMGHVQAVSLHHLYSPNHLAQHMAIGALNGGEDWLEVTRRMYSTAGWGMADKMKVAAPQGGTFLFFNVPELTGMPTKEFITACLNRGVLLAPGNAFGSDYRDYARLCFTSVAPSVLEDAWERIKGLFK